MADPATAPFSAPLTLTPGRRRQFRLLAVLLAVVTVCGLTELAFRLSDPPPRVALVRGSEVDDFRIVDGVPIWKWRSKPVLGPHEPAPAPCRDRRPDAPRIVFLGSSISYGVGLERNEALPSQVEQRLSDVTPSPCSDNLAEPGFGTLQQLTVARIALAAAPSAVVVWEIWDPAKVYSTVGDFAFDARGRALDARGAPDVPFVPSFFGDPLFRFSAAYEYTTLALLPRAETYEEASALDHVCKDVLPEVGRRTKATGGVLVALQAVALDRSLAIARGPTAEQSVADCARAQGLQVFSIAELLADQPVEEVRLDSCCHLNVHGNALLAERLAPKLAALLAP